MKALIFLVSLLSLNVYAVHIFYDINSVEITLDDGKKVRIRPYHLSCKKLTNIINTGKTYHSYSGAPSTMYLFEALADEKLIQFEINGDSGVVSLGAQHLEQQFQHLGVEPSLDTAI